jgi:hypothetical protein
MPGRRRFMVKLSIRLTVLLAALGIHALMTAPALEAKEVYRVTLNTLTVTPDGKKLFVLGEYGIGSGGVLRIYQGSEWREYQDHELLRATLAVNGQGERGWTAAAMGQDAAGHSVIYRFNGRAFQQQSERMAYTDFTCLAMSDDEKTVVAAGNRLNRKTGKQVGFLMEYKEGKWKEIKVQGPAITGKILALALDARGTLGWAAGEEGLLIKKSGNYWKTFPPPSNFPPGCSLRALALAKDKDDGTGGAVGDKGVIFNLFKGTGSLDLRSPTRESLTALCMSADGKVRWAFGDNLTVLSWNGSQWLPADIKKPKTEFTYIISACTPANGSPVYALASQRPAGMGWKQAVVKFDGKVWKEIYREKR